MQHSAIFFALTVLIVSFGAQPAKALDLRDYMPWLFGEEKENAPEDTLEAPFREQMDSQQKDKARQKTDNKKLMDLYEKKKPTRGSTRENIDQRHRSERQIALWVTEKVANALSFKPGNPNRQFRKIQPFFTKKAYQSYRRSLRQRRLLSSVRNRGLRMNALVEDDPFLVEEGSKQGVYKWRFDVPVMISFIDRGAEKAGNRQAMSQKVNVRVQVTRKKGRDKMQGVVIERWRIDNAGQ